MNLIGVVLGLIMVFIGVLIHANLAPDVIDALDTDTGEPLENASTTTKVIFSIEELAYGLIGLFLALGGAVAIIGSLGVKLPGMGR